MTFLRSSLFFLAFVLNTIFFALIASTFIWLIPEKSRFHIDGAWSRTNLFALKVICGLNYRVEGLENLPKGSFIALAKHQSTWETIALIHILNRPVAWVVKKELLSVPFFGWALRAFRAIAIDRKSGRKAVVQIVKEGINRLDAGLSIIIFPEGTRVAPGEKKRYGIGGSILAEKSGYPVVPIAHNAGQFWARRGINKYPGVIDVRIGSAIKTQGKSATEINSEVEEWIESTIDLLPQRTSGQ
ncbi:lysophospholipid acyltransferase family protein [Candidatus Endoriftia persephone]|jgi:1-acyl-sn-glycerol-3-phosphate acyltransferase|uniref:Phospholipid/glycerol acyltransferase n=2 Tax=Gammaproteobacteria TaxID=1236 RepID=G2D9R6_9GAMM|nr:lysophospholipid acyltransferase family protein [Candidatus Endoriftia persephone]EGV52618.1 phospholipid/glycerol acyltransferase [endosymbiont of Riftia pachyptila (vent Ph05)]USF87670.1 1-acyl-sn-glycerol-3-phosphate acyltransferase [Candidatus Endoriftia persephone]